MLLLINKMSFRAKPTAGGRGNFPMPMVATTLIIVAND